jgi:hypothetical protein
MGKESTKLPQVNITKQEIFSGRLAAIQAQMALEHGPIFRCTVEDF